MTSRTKRRGNRPAYPELEPQGLDAVEAEQQMFAGPAGADTKTIQLCRQVEEAISCALASSTSALLRDLYVVGVEPLRGAALMRVLVCTGGVQNDYQRINETLRRARGYLRAEIAQSIHRKRVPTLQFTLVPRPDRWPDENPEKEPQEVDHG